nr:hypothetical protein [Tanacetum cinerariifolium]
MRCRDTLEVFWDVNYRDLSRNLRVLQFGIRAKDPYEEAAQQLFEQPPHSPEYVPRDHVPVFVPEFEHPEDLVPAEDEAPASLLPPGFLSPRTSALLPIPLSTPSTSRRAGIPEADIPPRNRPLLATPRPGCEEDDGLLRVGQPEGQLPAVRAEIEVLRSERLAYEQEVLETHARHLEWQRQATDDIAVQHIVPTQALEARARDDTLEDTGSSS